MPPQERVRCRDRGDLPQGRPTYPVCPRRQSSAIVVAQMQSPGPNLTPQEPVLFDQITNRLPLTAIQPAGEHTQHHLQRRWVNHEPELISRQGQKTSIENWNTTGALQRASHRVARPSAP